LRTKGGRADRRRFARCDAFPAMVGLQLIAI